MPTSSCRRLLAAPELWEDEELEVELPPPVALGIVSRLDALEDVAEPDEELDVLAEGDSAVKLPHCSLFLQVVWPSRSLGCEAMHCWKVC